MKKPAKRVKLVLQREQVRTLQANDLKHAAGGFDSDVVNCVQLHPQAAPPTPGS